MTAKVGRDFNDVFVFVKVVTAGSFTAAGRELGLPKSTVSRRVSRLEQELGLRLLNRSTRKLSLTEAGRLYFDRSEQLFDGLVETEGALAATLAKPRGRVRVAAPAEHGISTELVVEFLAAFPEVQVDMELSGRDVNIVEEAFDVAIRPGPLTNESVVAHRLFESPFRLVASPQYLEARGAPKSVQELTSHDTLVFGLPNPNPSWTLPGPDAPTRVALKPRATFNHLDGVRAAALAGHGIALLPTLTCGRNLAAGELVVVLPEISPEPVTIWLTYASGRYVLPAVRAFIDFTKQRFHELAQSPLAAPAARPPERSAPR